MKKLVMVMIMVVAIMAMNLAVYAAADEPEQEPKKRFFTSIGEKADAAVGFVNRHVVKPATGAVKGAGKGIAKGASAVGGAVKHGVGAAATATGKTLCSVGQKLSKK